MNPDQRLNPEEPPQKNITTFFKKIFSFCNNKIFSTYNNQKNFNHLREIIDEISQYNLSEKQKQEVKMINDLLSFYEINLEEIKIPRNEIIAVDRKKIDQIFDVIKNKKVSRIIVYQDNLDNIIGFLHVKDVLLFYYQNQNLDNIEKLIQKILFVPPLMKAFNLLTEMKKHQIHIAVLIDEYGGTDGIVTINNIISEIVGEIDNEDPNLNCEIKDINEYSFEINPRISLDILKERKDIDLSKISHCENVETLNGLIISISNSIPKIGDEIILSEQYICKILSVDERMINKVIITKIHHESA